HLVGEHHTFPTRRSSDLRLAAYNAASARRSRSSGARGVAGSQHATPTLTVTTGAASERSWGIPRALTRARASSATRSAPAQSVADRKSTRLNSSHVKISY